MGPMGTWDPGRFATNTETSRDDAAPYYLLILAGCCVQVNEYKKLFDRCSPQHPLSKWHVDVGSDFGQLVAHSP